MRKSLFLTVFALVIVAAPAHAQVEGGVRAGVSANPDQFFIGGHLRVARIVDELWFQPNLEAGFGDNRTLIGLNFEFAYWIPLQRRWNVYFGGGPAINVISFDRPRGRDSDVEPGFNLLIGLAQRRGFLTEIKVGALDSPEVKFTLGWTF